MIDGLRKGSFALEALLLILLLIFVGGSFGRQAWMFRRIIRKNRIIRLMLDILPTLLQGN